MDARITPTPNGPLQAQKIGTLKNDRGETISTDQEIWLCRCGHSQTKPYCDGAHTAAKFSDKRVRLPGVPAEFAGKDLTVIDDFSLCAHAGVCVDRAPDTFFTIKDGKRTSNPDASPAEQVIAAIRQCPSGALLYKLKGKRVDQYASEAGIVVEKDGPYRVGAAALDGEARPATEDHYTLCRCGASLNKPFCDGMHAKIKFQAD
ncbi:MAG TPA: CDGSH iron-sulfur domain-containing protein [Opitutaceae bacterium]|jgi:CDGSH-type Zn-finger protein/ferredoxin|nr:CDGSH iron-sulfur domain-containing protein [Opitutaceae bacterium]